MRVAMLSSKRVTAGTEGKMKDRTTWVTWGVVAAGVAVGTVIGLGRLAGRASVENARRFAIACEAAGFAPQQCVFLAELDRRTNAAADDAAFAGLNAANASIQAAMSR